MTDTADEDLIAIGLEAVSQTPGLGVVDRVIVSERLDSLDRPAYYFDFRVYREPGHPPAGLARTRLSQRLRDALMARGDDHYPYTYFFTHDDWARFKKGA